MKKLMCLGLCLFILLSSNVLIFASTGGVAGLSASYVAFKDENGNTITDFPSAGSKVVGSTTVTNSGETKKAAVFWIGVYKDNVLVEIKYQRRLIPVGITYSFTAPAVTIPQGGTSENIDVKAYVWDSFTGANAIASVATMLKDDGRLRGIYIDDTLIEGFNNEKGSYTYSVPADTVKRPKITANVVDNATRVDISSYTVPGQAIITVTKGDGTGKTFTISTKFGAGKISNLANKLGSQTYKAFTNLRPQSLSELRNMYAAKPAGWEEYCRSYIDRTPSSIVDTITYSSLPSINAPHTGTGEYLTDYTGYSNAFCMWIAKGTKSGNTGDTSEFFNGASWIATGNNEKSSAYMTEAHDDAITFTIDRSATVWVASQSGVDTNLIANGWVKDTSGYKVVQGDGQLFSNLFRKHFDAGAVKIPTQVASLTRMYIPIVIWNEPVGLDNSDIATISYKMPNDDSYTALEGVSADIDSYSIDIPATANSDEIPKLNITPADSRSEVDITYPQSVPGTSAIVTITSVCGVQHQYTIHFITKIELAVGFFGTMKNTMEIAFKALFK